LASAECATEENKLFGSSDGDRNILEYAYELETNPNLILGSLSSDVLPELEVAFNDYLLPILFPETCAVSKSSSTSTNRLGQQQRNLQLMGLSAAPNDVPEPQIPCQRQVESGNTCFFIQGSLILYLKGNMDVHDLDQLVRDSLEEGMRKDVFLQAHPSIVRVTYVDTNSLIEGDINGSSDELERGQESDNNLVLPIVLASTACVMVAVGVAVFRRYTTSR
jgi:hypothetical protein